MESLTASTVFIVLTQRGLETARHITEYLPGAEIHGLAHRVDAADHVFAECIPHLQNLFRENRPIIGLCASGILIRALAPLLGDKTSEPPVLALAEDGSSIVPLLGGHHGANALAQKIADQLNITAAITTSSDRRFGVELDRPPKGWVLANPQHYKVFAAKLLAGAETKITGQAQWLQSSELALAETAELEICATHQMVSGSELRLVYHPKVLAIGVGCESWWRIARMM